MLKKEKKQRSTTVDIVTVTKDGKEYVGFHLSKEVTRKSTLNRVMKALTAYIKGLK